MNTLIVPFGVAVVSALVLLLHGSVVSRPVKHFLSRIRARATTEPLDAPDTTQSKVTDHIDSLGGRVIFFHMVLRAVCSIAVFILSVVTLLLERPRNSASGSYDILVMVGVPITLVNFFVCWLSTRLHVHFSFMHPRWRLARCVSSLDGVES